MRCVQTMEFSNLLEAVKQTRESSSEGMATGSLQSESSEASDPDVGATLTRAPTFSGEESQFDLPDLQSVISAQQSGTLSSLASVLTQNVSNEIEADTDVTLTTAEIDDYLEIEEGDDEEEV